MATQTVDAGAVAAAEIEDALAGGEASAINGAHGKLNASRP
jgi:hypothetical protein